MKGEALIMTAEMGLRYPFINRYELFCNITIDRGVFCRNFAYFATDHEKTTPNFERARCLFSLCSIPERDEHIKHYLTLTVCMIT